MMIKNMFYRYQILKATYELGFVPYTSYDPRISRKLLYI